MESYTINVLSHRKDAEKFQNARKIVTEANLAEANFRLVLELARDLFTKPTLHSNLAGGVDITRLEELIGDLIVVFRCIRRETMSKCPRGHDLKLDARAVATRNEQVPSRLLQRGYYRTICPLTVFLQLVAECLNKINLRKVNLDTPVSEWGLIRPLRQAMISLERRLSAAQDPENRGKLPGFGPCFMLHEEHSRFTVTSTAPKYAELTGLSFLGRYAREQHLSMMRAKCPAEVRTRIQRLEDHSEQMIAMYVANGRRDCTMPENHVFQDNRNQAPVPGFGASMNTRGEYKLACFLDFWRFQMTRPEGIERSAVATMVVKGDHRGTYSATSCAEWELWVTLLSSPAPRPIPFAQYVPMRLGMDKSGTWVTHQEQSSRPRPPNPLPGSRAELKAVLENPPTYPITTKTTWPQTAAQKPSPGIPQAMIQSQRGQDQDPRMHNQRQPASGRAPPPTTTMPRSLSGLTGRLVQQSGEAPRLKTKKSSFFSLRSS